MYKVGQKVRVTRNFNNSSAYQGGYREGQILVVSSVDLLGRPSFSGDRYQENGWGDADKWTTPITTQKPEIEVTQIRYLGRLYNLVEGE